MNQTQKVVLPTMPAPRKYQVPLDDGTVWTGTKRQLLESHPTWLPFAREVQPAPADEQDDDSIYDTRMPSSSRRYDLSGQGSTSYSMRSKVVETKIPPRRSAQTSTHTDDLPAAQTKPKRRIHWLAIAGIGAMVALLLWVGASWVTNWWTNTQNDWTYTQAFRTFSVDQAVGHNGDSTAHPSHFIVQNDKRKIVIVEFPANDPAKVIIYYGPILLGDGQDRTPITISFQTNLQTGRIDMVLHVEGQQYLFTNNGTKFVQPLGQ